MSFVKQLNEKFRIVLASNSPRRKELLERVGIAFEVWPSDKEEVVSSVIPKDICTELSRQKALDVASQIRTYNDAHPDLTTEADILVIGADTIVAKDDRILGKPENDAEAKNMLRLLSDNDHCVYTGVTFVFMSREGRVGEHTFYEETGVRFYPLDEEDIEEYVSSGDASDKAGAYGIQTAAASFVRSVEGDFYNVVGLPIARMLQELKGLM